MFVSLGNQELKVTGTKFMSNDPKSIKQNNNYPEKFQLDFADANENPIFSPRGNEE